MLKKSIIFIFILVFLCTIGLAQAPNQGQGGFFKRNIPIQCGPADSLKSKLQSEEMVPVFQGQVGDASIFLIIYMTEAPSKAFYITAWHPEGYACMLGSGANGSVLAPSEETTTSRIKWISLP